MRCLHLGFRVTGQEPVGPLARKTDDFELRQAAIECARKLEDEGWRFVTCSHVTRWTDDEEESLEPIDFRAEVTP